MTSFRNTLFKYDSSMHCLDTMGERDLICSEGKFNPICSLKCSFFHDEHGLRDFRCPPEVGLTTENILILGISTVLSIYKTDCFIHKKKEVEGFVNHEHNSRILGSKKKWTFCLSTSGSTTFCTKAISSHNGFISFVVSLWFIYSMAGQMRSWTCITYSLFVMSIS